MIVSFYYINKKIYSFFKNFVFHKCLWKFEFKTRLIIISSLILCLKDLGCEPNYIGTHNDNKNKIIYGDMIITNYIYLETKRQTS